ncbi:hypothetical protein [Calycomorphotria hydatis]|uniref:DnaJ domain protein n=1 Tax=Calycomorphotria hydatis TaxID=2528027 RepID=A0A517TB00_9PLAN|nr:hypothetical protein [Calycomorphotria hydatis]QDT65547.1 DnaJ domain protein [Calycomorphotria hydatis]
MSDLPDDVSQWPNDPRLLLGVDRHTDEKTLRRAYTKLIRKYKPEQYPEEFQRIRAAYEQLKQIIAYGGFSREIDYFQTHSSSTTSRGERTSSGSTSAGETEADSNRNEVFDDPEARKPRESPEAIAWKLLREGDPGQAYEDLATLHRQGTATEETYLSLYWIVILFPKVVQSKEEKKRFQACEWLVLGMERLGLRDRLLQVYNYVLKQSRSEVLGPRSLRVFDCKGPFDRRLSILEQRWNAALTYDKIHLIEDDLKHCRHRGLDTTTAMDLQMLASAYERAVWFRCEEGKSFSQKLLLEIGEAEGADNSLDYLHERTELLSELMQELYTTEWDEGVEILRDYWVNDCWEVRQRYLDMVSHWVDSPSYAFQYLLDLGKQSPLAVYLLGEIGSAICPSWMMWSDEEDAERVKQVVRDFYLSNLNPSNRSPRLLFAQFCFREFLSFELAMSILTSEESIVRQDKGFIANHHNDLILKTAINGGIAALSEL